MAPIRITTEQLIPVDVAPVTSAGNPAPIDGTPVYQIDDPTVASITQPGDTATGCLLVSVGVGTTKIRGTVDADLGSGVRTIPFEEDVIVLTPEAAAVTVTSGEARLK